MSLVRFDASNLCSTAQSVTLYELAEVKKSYVIKGYAQDGSPNHEHYSANSQNHDEHKRIVEEIKLQLYNRTFTNECKRMINIKSINDVIERVYALPPITTFNKRKPLIPEFDVIEVLPSDSAEIKKFIRKINYDFVGFSCNHKHFDKCFNMIDADISKIFESPEYIEYDTLITGIAGYIHETNECDIRDVDYYVDKKERRTILNACDDKLRAIIDTIFKLNSNITAANAKCTDKCHKCKAAVRKYNYSLDEIERMREDEKQQSIITAEVVGEDKYNVVNFVNTNYPSMDRIPFTDIRKHYKTKLGVGIRVDELRIALTESNKWKVTNAKGYQFAVRL